jgi:hypothetical protein
VKRMGIKNQIIEQHKMGKRNHEIAKYLGCSRAYVSKVIKDWFEWTGFVPALGDEHQAWLACEARRLNVTPELLVRGILVDAIEEEMRSE